MINYVNFVLYFKKYKLYNDYNNTDIHNISEIYNIHILGVYKYLYGLSVPMNCLLVSFQYILEDRIAFLKWFTLMYNMKC